MANESELVDNEPNSDQQDEHNWSFCITDHLKTIMEMIDPVIEEINILKAKIKTLQ